MPTPGKKIIATQTPFAIPTAFMTLLRPELLAIRYTHDNAGRLMLEPKEEMVARLKRSPDFADTFIQSFAFPD